MIYCVEDDTAIRELEIYTLRASGYEAEGFANSLDFWEAMKKEKPELVLLDIMLPDEDGLTILKRLRAGIDTAELPVILASAKGTEYDKVFGLDVGADDYLAKPFGMMEMVSRIRAVLRRSHPAEKIEFLTYGEIRINEKSHEVTLAGNPLDLTLKEYNLLRLFIKKPGEVFTRENLLTLVWENDSVVETRTVDVHIATLRNKIGTYGKKIKTIRSIGYRLEKIDD